MDNENQKERNPIPETDFIEISPYSHPTEHG
jgi:hypothetical protein